MINNDSRLQLLINDLFLMENDALKDHDLCFLLKQLLLKIVALEASNKSFSGILDLLQKRTDSIEQENKERLLAYAILLKDFDNLTDRMDTLEVEMKKLKRFITGL